MDRNQSKKVVQPKSTVRTSRSATRHGVPFQTATALVSRHQPPSSSVSRSRVPSASRSRHRSSSASESRIRMINFMDSQGPHSPTSTETLFMGSGGNLPIVHRSRTSTRTLGMDPEARRSQTHRANSCVETKSCQERCGRTSTGCARLPSAPGQIRVCGRTPDPERRTLSSDLKRRSKEVKPKKRKGPNNSKRSKSKNRKKSKDKDPEREAMLALKAVEFRLREEALKLTLKELIVYFIFVIVVSIVGVFMASPTMYYFTKAMELVFIDVPFLTTNDIEIDFNRVRTVEDLWFYLEYPLMDALYWKKWYNGQNLTQDEQKVLYQNLIIGVTRLRQLRTRSDSCEVHEYFQDYFLACYNEYSTESEDQEPFGPGKGPGWVYAGSKDTGNQPYWGKVATYGGGGYYVDLAANREKSVVMIKNLKENLWITRATRCVFVELAVYNANLNLFCIMKIVFELPPTGGVITSHRFNTLKLIRYVAHGDYVVRACEWLIVGFLLYFVYEEIMKISKLGFKIYIKHFWNYMAFILMLVGLTNVIFVFVLRTLVGAAIKENADITDKYANFEKVETLQIVYNCLFVIFLFLVYIKIFKYFAISSSMGILNNTLHRCAQDILGFTVMFLVIFTAYAELGYLLFGTRVVGFSTMRESMFTLMCTILGDFNYSEIEEANRILAPIFFFSYIFLVFFVLLNMFLAIINDTYSEVKDEDAIAPEEMQMSEYLKRGWAKIKKVLSSNKGDIKKEQKEYEICIADIRGALRKCGFTNLEVEMFFRRFKIDPNAQVNKFNINKLIGKLDDPTSKKRVNDFISGGIFTIDDYFAQQDRLREIEQALYYAAGKTDELLAKLEEMDIVAKNETPIEVATQTDKLFESNEAEFSENEY